MRIALLAIFMLIAHTGAWAQAPKLKRFQHQGRERRYLLFAPKTENLQRPRPLLVVLHGRLGTGKQIMEYSGFNKIAAREGFIVAYPDGYKRSWHDGRDIGPAAEAKIDDYGFINALIDEVSQRYTIDPARVAICGISNGGFMALSYSVRNPERIAAVAAVTASISQNDLALYQGSKPFSALIMNGTEDPLVPYQGGQVARNRGEIVSTREAIRLLADNNTCDSSPPQTISMPDRSDDGTTTQVLKWNCAESGKETCLYEVQGGGHTWPGKRQYMSEKQVGRTSRDFDGSEMIWDFLKRQTR